MGDELHRLIWRVCCASSWFRDETFSRCLLATVWSTRSTCRLVAAVERREAEVAAAVAVAAVRGAAVVRTVRSVPVVDQVYVAEVAVVVRVAVRVATVVWVAWSRRARLDVRVAVGTYHEWIVIFVVESVVTAFSCIRPQCKTAIYSIVQ